MLIRHLNGLDQRAELSSIETEAITVDNGSMSGERICAARDIEPGVQRSLGGWAGDSSLFKMVPPCGYRCEDDFGSARVTRFGKRPTSHWVPSSVLPFRTVLRFCSDCIVNRAPSFNTVPQVVVGMVTRAAVEAASICANLLVVHCRNDSSLPPSTLKSAFRRRSLDSSSWIQTSLSKSIPHRRAAKELPTTDNERCCRRKTANYNPTRTVFLAFLFFCQSFHRGRPRNT